MSTDMETFNALVEEFDLATAGRFDTVTDIHELAAIASCWPACRPGLGEELVKAHSMASDPFLELNRQHNTKD